MSIFLGIFVAPLLIASDSEFSPADIDWFKGSVEEAFVAAKTSRRPLFLYWGAVWCPPCNKMKKTVFSQPLFQEKMRRFVPVYFDGDQDRAQIWGEKLKAKGYPTLMILNPDGKEIMRLPVNVSVERYVELLDTALRGNVRSIGQIIGDVRTRPPIKISRQEWKMLAGHSWFQDGMETAERLSVLRDLWKKVPVAYKEERYHFFIYHVSSMEKTAEKRDDYVSFLDTLLNDQDFLNKNFANVILKLPGIIEKVHNEESSQKRKTAARDRLLKIAAGRKGTAEDRLLSLYPTLVFQKGKLGDTFKKQLLDVVQEIDKAVKDPQERQDIMSTSVMLLIQAGLLENAKSVALKELKNSPSPFYFMSMLSSIEEKGGNSTAALEWSKKAWMKSQGASTRLSWGTRYLLKMLSLNPKGTLDIVNTFEKVFREIVNRPDAFSGHNRDYFLRLGKGLEKWPDSEGRKKIWETTQKYCDGVKDCREQMEKWGFKP